MLEMTKFYYSKIETWGKHQNLVHVKRNILGKIIHWHFCAWFQDHICSQDTNHILEKEYRIKNNLKPFIW